MGSKTSAQHAAAVSIPSTWAIETWSSQPTVAAQIERVNRGGTANSYLDWTHEYNTRRGNKPDLIIDQAVHLQDTRPTSYQCKKKRVMNAVVKEQRWYHLKLRRSCPTAASTFGLTWTRYSLRLKTNHTMIRNTTQQSTKRLDECTSSLSNTDTREIMQRITVKYNNQPKLSNNQRHGEKESL